MVRPSSDNFFVYGYINEITVHASLSSTILVSFPETTLIVVDSDIIFGIIPHELE